MHAAPTVTYPVGRSRFAGASLLVAWLTGLAVCASWWAVTPSPGWRLAVAGVALAVSGALASRKWWLSPSGELKWDGGSWHWSAVGHVEAPEVSLDLQGHMLVHCRCGRTLHWLWLERSRSAHRWDDLRRAVYSRARPDALRQAMPPAAKP